MRATLPLALPPGAAWAAFSRVEAWPRWDWMGSADAAWTDGDPWRQGSVLRLGHRPFTFECVLVRVDPPRAVTWSGGGLGIAARHTFRFHAHPTGCLIESEEIFEGRGARLIRPLVRWYWRRHLLAFRRFAHAEAAAGRDAQEAGVHQ